MDILSVTRQNLGQLRFLDESFNFNRREMVNVPLIGRVAAGEPLLAQQNIENYFPIPMEFMPNNQTFMLTVLR